MNPTNPYTMKTPIASPNPKIVVIGLGGGGSNAINRMIESGMQGVTFIAANTDAQALAANKAPHKIQLGPQSTRGLGAGGQPETGRLAADESRADLAQMLQGAEMVFLTCGMGGGTGTGSIPIAAQIAKESGALTIAIVTKPFSFELGKRQRNTEEGLSRLRRYCDTLIVIPNDKLIEVAPRDLPLTMAFTLADDVLRQGVQGISELITETGLINVDFSHIKNIMSKGGGALMAIGTGTGPNKVQQAIEKALHHPLLDDVDLFSAKGMIANFTGSYNMSFKEVTDALKTLHDATGGHSEIIPGIITDPRMEDRVQLILIVTGIGTTADNFETVDTPYALHQEASRAADILQPNTAPAPKPAMAKSPIEPSFEFSNEAEKPDYSHQQDQDEYLSIPAFLRRKKK
ncbi:MAG: cell division protein FtsZ [Anaerolineaceae bacterium]|nr:cell division protein FtsZ [Anaerolineaceae bacterium]